MGIDDQDELPNNGDEPSNKNRRGRDKIDSERQ